MPTLFIPEDGFILQRTAFLKELGFSVATYAQESFPTGLIPLNEDPRSFLRTYKDRVSRHLLALPSYAADRPYLIITTAVFCGRRLIGHSSADQEALKILDLLSGRRHRLYTLMGLLGHPTERIEITRVKVKRLDNQEKQDLMQSFPLYPFPSLFQRKIESIMGPPGNLEGIPFLQAIHFLKGVGLLK